MSSFSHLSASHNSNNGNPKKHWRAPAWCDSAIWDGARPFCRDHARAHPPPAGTARKLVLRQGTKSWPARPVVGNLSFGASEESIRALFETHGTVSLTAGGGASTMSSTRPQSRSHLGSAVVLRVETSRETPSTSATLEVAPQPHLDSTGHRGMAAMPAAGASVCRLDHDFLAPKATSNVCRISMCLSLKGSY